MSLEVITGTMGAMGFAGGVADTRKKNPDDPGDVRTVRWQQGVAIAGSFVIAAYLANQQNSPKPYLYWLVAIAAIVLLYECALRDRKDVG